MDKPSNVVSFKDYLNKKTKRKDHMSWGDNDLQKVTGPRDTHFVWGEGDIVLLKDRRPVKPPIKEGVAEPITSFKKKEYPKDNDGLDMGTSNRYAPRNKILHVHAMSAEEMGQHAKNWHEHLSNTDHNERGYYGVYKGDSEELINRHLRNSAAHTDSLINLMDHKIPILNHMHKMTSFKTQHDATVYRGFEDGYGFHTDAKPGQIYQDHGFTNTTHKPYIAHKFAGTTSDENGNTLKTVAKIHVPKGSMGHFIDIAPNAYSHESEFVLHRGTKFKVLGHSRHYGPENNLGMEPHRYHFVHLQVIGHDPKPVKAMSDD